MAKSIFFLDWSLIFDINNIIIGIMVQSETQKIKLYYSFNDTQMGYCSDDGQLVLPYYTHINLTVFVCDVEITDYEWNYNDSEYNTAPFDYMGSGNYTIVVGDASCKIAIITPIYAIVFIGNYKLDSRVVAENIVYIDNSLDTQINIHAYNGYNDYTYSRTTNGNTIVCENKCKLNLDAGLHYINVCDKQNMIASIRFQVKHVLIPEISFKLIIEPLFAKFNKKICDTRVEYITNNKYTLQSADTNKLFAEIPNNESYTCFWQVVHTDTQQSMNDTHDIVQTHELNTTHNIENIIKSNQIMVIQSGEYIFSLMHDNNLIFAKSFHITVDSNPFVILNINGDNINHEDVYYIGENSQFEKHVHAANITLYASINISYLKNHLINYKLYLNDDVVDESELHLIDSKAIIDLGNYIITSKKNKCKLILYRHEIIDAIIVYIVKNNDIPTHQNQNYANKLYK